MVEDYNDNENEFEPGPPVPPEQEYMAMSAIAPAKTVDLPVDAGASDAPKSLTESMDDATDLTDMQFGVAKLFPKQLSRNDLMIARVDPAAFLSLHSLMVTDDIMASDPTKPINVTDSIIKNYVNLTIGLEGEGRIDLGKMMGAAAERRKQENLIKNIS